MLCSVMLCSGVASQRIEELKEYQTPAKGLDQKHGMWKLRYVIISNRLRYCVPNQ